MSRNFTSVENPAVTNDQSTRGDPPPPCDGALALSGHVVLYIY